MDCKQSVRYVYRKVQMMRKLEEHVRLMVENGGPEPNQYNELNEWFQSIGRLVRTENIAREQVKEMWSLFGDAFSVNTLQGFGANKPHGYAGDFEIIDKIYTKWISPRADLYKWDEFFHWQKAPIAVRNREEYFKRLLSDIVPPPDHTDYPKCGQRALS